jgi:class 3 adenylate cyclase
MQQQIGFCSTADGVRIAYATVGTGPALVVAPWAPSHLGLEWEEPRVQDFWETIGCHHLVVDPEEARAIVDPALKLMMDAVHHFGGYVAQSTGDGIFALFGAPVAHEDHPQRALLAGLRLQDDLRRCAAQLREEGNPPVEARVGVNTGELVVRSLATGVGHVEYAPIGHSTSLAARMQTLAPTGSIAVTDTTRRLCEGCFLFEALGPTKVKGVTEPVNVYEVTGLGPLHTRL